MIPDSQMSPQDDIGPFYRFLGAVVGIGMVAFLVLGILHDHAFTWFDVGILSGFVLLELALIRPQFFDSTMKTLADHLPFFKFSKDA